MLRPGGYIFFRESHFKPVGDRVDSTNPTKYRSLKVQSSFEFNIVVYVQILGLGIS